MTQKENLSADDLVRLRRSEPPVSLHGGEVRIEIDHTNGNAFAAYDCLSKALEAIGRVIQRDATFICARIRSGNGTIVVRA